MEMFWLFCLVAAAVVETRCCFIRLAFFGLPQVSPDFGALEEIWQQRMRPNDRVFLGRELASAGRRLEGNDWPRLPTGDRS